MPQIADKPGVMLYFDVIGPLMNHLEDQELGALLRGMVDYSLTGLAPELDPFSPVSMAWDVLLPHLDRDTERYRAKLEQSRYANYCKTQKQLGYTPLPRETWLSSF